MIPRLHRLPPKPMMVGYLMVLLVFSALALHVPNRLVHALVVVIVYVVLDLLWTYVRDHTWYLPSSSVISGLILALIGPTTSSSFAFIALPALAVLSKQLFHFGKPRHVFNPAAFALGSVGIFTASPSWWAVAWGAAPATLVGLSGIGILWRQKRFHVFFPFVGAYAIGLAAVFLISSIPIGDVGALLLRQLFDGTALFFATVMVVEPMTSQFPTVYARATYGAIVGIATAALTYTTGRFGLDRFDPFIWGLLIGNLISSFVFLTDRNRIHP